MKNKRLSASLLGIIAGVMLILFLCAAALGLLLGFDTLYKIDIRLLDIESYSGYDYDTIIRNYKATVAYLNPFKDVGVFTLPDLAVSEVGEIHFSDVRNITNAVFLLGAASVIPITAFFLLGRRMCQIKKQGYIAAGATMLALPAAVFAAVAVDTDRFFVLFHEIFFSNDCWIFDWYSDQVIRILPMEFFIHCAVVIALFWVAGSAVMLAKGISNIRRS